MSRLQVGGLALDLESGCVCVLLDYFGDGWDVNGNLYLDNWRIEFDQPQCCSVSGRIGSVFYQQAKYLMPLGDKQTQDELAKEKELEYT